MKTLSGLALRLAVLAGSMAVCLAAQTVTNAAVSDVGLRVLYAVNSSGSANVIAPRMLAVLSYGLFNPWANYPGQAASPPVQASLWIRPVGSTNEIPVTLITNAVAGTVSFVVPAAVPFGGAELEYKIDNQPTQWTAVTVVQADFEFFRIGPGGPVIAQLAGPGGKLTSAGLSTTAQPGQMIVLDGTGLGYGSNVSATIGGIAASVLYAGPDALRPGHDQISLQLPPGVPDSCYVPLTVTYNQTTVTTTISKSSNGGPCQHPFGLSVSDLKSLDAGGVIVIGEIDMNSNLLPATSTLASRQEFAQIYRYQAANADVASYFSPSTRPSGCVADPPLFGAFLSFNNVYLGGNVSGPVNYPPLPDLGLTMVLQNAVTTLRLSTYTNIYYPDQFPNPMDGTLAALPAPVIAPGKWTWSSPGTPDLPASSFTFTLPAPLQINGPAPLFLRRNQDQTLSWNGSSFDSHATMEISLGNITCITPASTGSLTVPAALLSTFIPGRLETLYTTVSESGFFSPSTRITLKDGETLVMAVSYSTGDTRGVVFQ